MNRVNSRNINWDILVIITLYYEVKLLVLVLVG